MQKGSDNFLSKIVASFFHNLYTKDAKKPNLSQCSDHDRKIGTHDEYTLAFDKKSEQAICRLLRRGRVLRKRCTRFKLADNSKLIPFQPDFLCLPEGIRINDLLIIVSSDDSLFWFAGFISVVLTVSTGYCTVSLLADLNAPSMQNTATTQTAAPTNRPRLKELVAS